MTQLDFEFLWCVADFGWIEGLAFWTNIYEPMARD